MLSLAISLISVMNIAYLKTLEWPLVPGTEEPSCQSCDSVQLGMLIYVLGVVLSDMTKGGL